MMYSFFRLGVSFDRCDWLAMSISGRSHVVSTSKGAESESEKITVKNLDYCHLVGLDRRG